MKKELVLLALTGILLASCSSSKDANEANFKKAVQAYLDENPVCYVDMEKVPNEIRLDKLDYGYDRVKADKDRFDALVELGLLQSKTTTKIEKNWGVTKEFELIQYDLTDEGKKYFKDSCLAFGKKKVTKITNFTEPADAMGVKMSDVRYQYQIGDFPDWVVKNSEFLSKIAAFDYLTDVINSKQEPLNARGYIILTNEGWIHEKLYKGLGW